MPYQGKRSSFSVPKIDVILGSRHQHMPHPKPCIPRSAHSPTVLPLPVLQRCHLLRDLPHRRQDQSPSQFRGRIRRCAGMLAGGQNDAVFGTCVDVDVRVNASLADEFQPRKALYQRPSYFGPFSNEDERFCVAQPRCEFVNIRPVIGPDPHVMVFELRKTRKMTKRIKIVVQYADLHSRPSLSRSIQSRCLHIHPLCALAKQRGVPMVRLIGAQIQRNLRMDAAGLGYDAVAIERLPRETEKR